jgi:hypothetical protein
MRKITPILSSSIKKHIKNADIYSSKPFHVDTFNELVRINAELSYLNKDYLIFYRGQPKDYLNQSNATTIYPSIYRRNQVKKYELKTEFEILDQLGKKLGEKAQSKGIHGSTELLKKKYIQWSIIQHYELWKTPLLDITQSLRVACSFAQYDNVNETNVVYIFGLPYISNRISINSEHDLVNVRLLSICPPSALRPYFQEGYLIGTTDITYDFDDKSDLDFSNRLIAKISIPNNNSFWGKKNSAIPKELLFPSNDKFQVLCMELLESIEYMINDSDYGALIKEWSNLERAMLNKFKNSKERKNISISQVLKWLYENEELSSADYKEIMIIKNIRNKLVHEGYGDLTKDEVNQYIELMKSYNVKLS